MFRCFLRLEISEDQAHYAIYYLLWSMASWCVKYSVHECRAGHKTTGHLKYSMRSTHWSLKAFLFWVLLWWTGHFEGSIPIAAWKSWWFTNGRQLADPRWLNAVGGDMWGLCVCRSLTDVAGVRPRCQPDAKWDVWGFGPNQMALGMMGVFFSLSVCVVTLTYLLSSGIFLERKCKNLISFQCITNSLFLFVLFSPASSAHSSLGKVGDLFKLLALKKSTNTLTH